MDTVTTNIVVACDGSDHAVHAARLAADLARATGQPLKLLSVFPGSRYERMVLRGDSRKDLDREVRTYGRQVFDAVEEALSGIADPVEEILLRGDPAKEIIEYLENNPGDHLVMGRRGHSMVRSLTLGSISEKVVRHATSPVTVVSE
ncbi:universal stress protein [Marinobacter sp. X15-166B]|uniref:universal stress protein n=1 Tax=Marinobacter sp. X15-166B TaxID=1897620 RepID=UPI00085BC58D|nr:universal stress protein [Marinobacter sp. X15-166B]OEY65562.1 universal stress protein UspA [Marinobacter sp. X15-166B]